MLMKFIFGQKLMYLLINNYYTYISFLIFHFILLAISNYFMNILGIVLVDK